MTGDPDELRFEGYRLCPGTGELLGPDGVVPVEPQVFTLIRFLAANPDRLISRDELIEAVWRGRIVSDAAIASRINAARTALGDDGRAQRIIRTVPRRGFRFLGQVEAAGGLPPAAAAAAPAAPATPAEIRYLAAPDGVHLAHASLGEGPVIVKTTSFLTHLEHDLESPVWRHWVAALAARNRYVRYDQRGNGLSDRGAEAITFEAFVSDLETVIDGLGLDRVALLGISQGAAIAIEYARRHPERVSRMVLHGGYAAGWRRIGETDWAAQREALLDLVTVGWGSELPAWRQLYSSLFFPEGDAALHGWFNRLQQISATPEAARRILDAFGDIDVRDSLPRLDLPVLVTHCRGDQIVPFEAGRRLAAAIPGARFLALDSPNHVVLESEPAWPRLAAAIARFLAEERP
ncbi:alpha/beta fold hydrolase [Paralimibaculum aggregatum]|uniref:Alpha/beta fold hydrolase n=1 Tax=Paralimibaculum aggregatum TaxID=3036245 RepID=A0ABQ6LLQ3_9RHOB|nr:alpha/beta fold hydrolase [Limibaculum sp. NKW23]GMG82168.1 alpha/beta fold hydrolase [Limibaculum sp. NKW23]